MPQCVGLSCRFSGRAGRVQALENSPKAGCLLARGCGCGNAFGEFSKSILSIYRAREGERRIVFVRFLTNNKYTARVRVRDQYFSQNSVKRPSKNQPSPEYGRPPPRGCR